MRASYAIQTTEITINAKTTATAKMQSNDTLRILSSPRFCRHRLFEPANGSNPNGNPAEYEENRHPSALISKASAGFLANTGVAIVIWPATHDSNCNFLLPTLAGRIGHPVTLRIRF